MGGRAGGRTFKYSSTGKQMSDAISGAPMQNSIRLKTRSATTWGVSLAWLFESGCTGSGEEEGGEAARAGEGTGRLTWPAAGEGRATADESLGWAGATASCCLVCCAASRCWRWYLGDPGPGRLLTLPRLLT